MGLTYAEQNCAGQSFYILFKLEWRFNFHAIIVANFYLHLSEKE